MNDIPNDSSMRKRQNDNSGTNEPPTKQRGSISDRLGENVYSGYSNYRNVYGRDNSRDRDPEHDKLAARNVRFRRHG